jgi:tetratricopeptide (TPR) repeat protein
MPVQNLNPIAEAARFLEAGNLAAAERMASDLLAGQENPDALHLLGLVRFEQNRMGDAVALLNRSLAARPGHPDVLCNLAKAFLAMGRDGKAAQALEAALAARPGMVEAWYELGELKFRNDDNGGAEACFRKVLALAPDHGAAKLWLGVALKNAGHGAEAEPILAEGLRQAGEAKLKAAFAYNLAHAQYAQGRKREALENFAYAGRLDSGLNTDLNRADVLEELMRVDEAVALLEQVLQREPDNVQAHFSYNNLLFRLGRDENFLKSYDRAPQTAPLLAAKAGLLLKKDRFEEAYDLYRRALIRDPANLDAAIGSSTALNMLHRSAEAMAPLEQALKHHPKNGMLYQNIAITALQAKDPQKAAAMAEQSLRLLPVDQAGLAVLGSAWRMMGDERDEMLNGYDDLIRVFDLEPPEGFSSMADFNAELNAWLDQQHATVREPLEQSLKGGSQTRGYIFGQGHALAEKLRTRISEALLRFIAEVKKDARHPFRGRAAAGGFMFGGSWSSRLHDCGFHVNHIHPGGWISSCYYVGLPEAVKDETEKQGWIKFGEPSFDVGLGMRRAIQPQAGRLVLFPSYMWHGTIPFREDAARTTIAFDAVPGR